MTAAGADSFQQIKCLTGHTDSINAIEFSADGKYMATGGDDAHLLIFDTTTWTVQKKYRTVSPIRAIAWHKEYLGVISFGMRNGVVKTLTLKNDVDFEHTVNGVIHCMAFDDKGKLLAVGFNNEVLVARQTSISAWTSERHLLRPPNHSTGHEDITASVNFLPTENAIVVTYMYGGIVAYDLNNITTKRWSINVQGIWYDFKVLSGGDSALSPASRLLATTIMFNGIQWYDVNNRKAVTTKQSEENNLNVILPVIFISGTTIAVGSAIGNVSIFKFGKAEPTQILKHHALGHFHDEQTAAHILVTGISEQYDESVLTVWKASSAHESKKLKSFQFSWTFWGTTVFALGAIVVAVLYPRHTDNIKQTENIKQWREYLSIPSGWYPESLSQDSGQVIVTEISTQIVTKTVMESTNPNTMHTPVASIQSVDETQVPMLSLPSRIEHNLPGEANTSIPASEPITRVKPSALGNRKVKARYPAPVLSREAQLEMLGEELAGLFAQTLPGTNFASLIAVIKQVAEGSTEDIGDLVTTLLTAHITAEPLGNKQRTNLIDAVVARVYNYTLNKGVHHTSSGHVHPSPFLSQTPQSTAAAGKAPVRNDINKAGKAPVRNEPKAPHPTSSAAAKLSIDSNSGSFRSQSSEGTFHWYTTTSDYDLDSPVEIANSLKPGDFFFHTNSKLAAPDTPQVWLYNRKMQWEDISDIWAHGLLLVHPTLPDRVLTIREDQSPNWVLKATLAQKRRICLQCKMFWIRKCKLQLISLIFGLNAFGCTEN
ncbi:WD40-repeat-containing domain protein [Mycena alexandri]|uniref:WD40-repeat-containing domain protein n=1 Tax=Mycena alexandri TaxID=1745969 RepID=A0AAD6T7I1_9AGAR|nr:WD40-repeat-containing domain protein [Mycena alexandri]